MISFSQTLLARSKSSEAELYIPPSAHVSGRIVGIHSVIGEKYLKTVTDEISRYGLDVTGINSIGGSGLELWILHETENEKQQVPKLSSSTALEMDSGRRPLPEPYLGARSGNCHIK